MRSRFIKYIAELLASESLTDFEKEIAYVSAVELALALDIIDEHDEEKLLATI